MDQEMNEGNVLQVLHIGPYSEEGATIQKLCAALRRKGYQSRGPVHDIYFDDPRQTPPEECRALIRLPFCKESDEILDFADEKKLVQNTRRKPAHGRSNGK